MADLNTHQFTNFVKTDEKVTVHGNFTDSIPYYQVTIPIKSREEVKSFFLKQIAESVADPYNIADPEDKPTIEDFPHYSLYNSKNEKITMALDDNYLVILGLTEEYEYDDYYDIETVDSTEVVIEDSVYSVDYDRPEIVDTTAVIAEDTIMGAYDDDYDKPEIVEIKGVIAEDPILVDIASSVELDIPEVIDMTDVMAEDSTVVDNVYDDEGYVVGEETHDNVDFQHYKHMKSAFDSIQFELQNTSLKSLFEHDFMVPSSNKINKKADISSWVDYGSIISSLSSVYQDPTSYFPYGEYFQRSIGKYAKGINLDFYFDNDNARIEETIECSEPIAEAIKLMHTRKINKNVFKYFPAQEPFAYMTYHMSTKEMLINYPTIVSTIFGENEIFGKDMDMIIDITATMLDEKATATLFDGDLSIFVYDVIEKEETIKSFEYDENYEQVEVEEKVKRSILIFSLIFTSTHPTFVDNLIQLGIRKESIVSKGDYYKIVGTQEYGDIFIVKDKDVVVLGNSLDNVLPKSNLFSKKNKKGT